MSLTGITLTQTGLVSSVDLAGVQAALSIQIAAKADSSNVYSTRQVDAIVSSLQTQSDSSSKLSGKADVSTLQSTQAQVTSIASSVASLQSGVAAGVTQTQLASAVAPLATSAALSTATQQIAAHDVEITAIQGSAASAIQPADLASAVSPLASKELLAANVAPLASKAELATAIAPLAKSSDVAAALALKSDDSATDAAFAAVNSALATHSAAISSMQQNDANTVHSAELASAVSAAVAPLASKELMNATVTPVSSSVASQAAAIAALQTSVATCVRNSELQTAISPLVPQSLLNATVSPLATQAALSAAVAPLARSSEVAAAFALKADISLIESELESRAKVTDFAPVQAASVAATQWINTQGATKSYVDGIQDTLQAEMASFPTQASVTQALTSMTAALASGNSGGGGIETVTGLDSNVSLPIQNAGASYQFKLTNSTGAGPNELQLFKGSDKIAAVTHDTVDHLQVYSDLIAPSASISTISATSVSLAGSDLAGRLSTLAPLDSVYTKTSVDTALALKANQTITYSKSEVDAAVALKAPQSSTYTKTEVDTAVALKAAQSITYTKAEVDTAMALKAPQSTTYTKTQVDAAVAVKANLADPTFSGTARAPIFYDTTLNINVGSVASAAQTQAVAANSTASAAQTTASAAQTTASAAQATAHSALSAAQASGSSFSVPSDTYASDLLARDVGGVDIGEPYSNTSGQVCISRLPPAQYGYDLVGDQFISGHGVQLASHLPTSICDLTIEAFINVSQLGQSLLFDISNQGETNGNIFGGFNGGGCAYIQVGTKLFTTNIVPMTNNWINFGFQLQRQVGTSYIWVNILTTAGGMTNLGTVLATDFVGLNGWGSRLTVGQHAGGDYPFKGSFSNFRLSTAAVYASPYNMKPPFYNPKFPMSVESSTAVLLQGKPIANVADPLRTVTSITMLSNFPYPLVSPLISNLPTYGGVSYRVATGTLSAGSVNCNAMSGVDWTFDLWVNVAAYNGDVFVVDLRPNAQTASGGLSFYMSTGKWSIYAADAALTQFTAPVPLNKWVHSAIMRKQNTLWYFQDGVPMGGQFAVPGALNALNACTALTIGTTVDGALRVNGSISQPLIRKGAQYATTGFTPAPNLAPSASAAGMDTLLFVDAVEGSNTPYELVNVVPLQSTGTTSNAIRYMAY